MASTRRLAAILAADVAGYSRLMGADEEGTHKRLKAHRRELLDPKIGERHGRIVKNTGDGMLAEFASVVDAMRCAAELQRAMVDRETGMSKGSQIRFRIGTVPTRWITSFGDAPPMTSHHRRKDLRGRSAGTSARWLSIPSPRRHKAVGDRAHESRPR
jgi:hypothetical protein